MIYSIANHEHRNYTVVVLKLYVKSSMILLNKGVSVHFG